MIEELPHDPDDRGSDGFVAWLAILAAAATEDELFEGLASQRPPQSKLARQQLRGRLVKLLTEKLKELDSGVSAAQTADAWLQEGGQGDDLLQGKTFVAEETVPWESSVTGTAVLDEAARIFDAYLSVSAEGRDALALWAAFSHVFDSFGTAPLFDLSSPTKRCGKSTAIVVLRHLCHAPLLSSNITPAALFRAVEAWKPTLLIDEADTFAGMNDELRGIINSGHTRDTAFVVRAEGDANEPRMFSTWAPKVVAAIGHLPDTIEDRSIRLVLTRKPISETKRDAFDGETVRADCTPVRRRLARFLLDNIDAITAAVIDRPAGLHDRAWNNWRPLFAIAKVAGGDWPARAVQAAQVLAESSDDGDGEDVGTLALRHVWAVLEPAGRLPTGTILAHLVEQDEGPWARWWETPLSKTPPELRSPSARLAKLLKPFGIRPKQVWIDGQKTRGYDAEDFTAASISAYLQKDGRDGKDGRSQATSHAGSTVLTVPTVFSEVAKGCPLIGDRGYPELLFAAFEAGHVTADEWTQLSRLHQKLEAAA